MDPMNNPTPTPNPSGSSTPVPPKVAPASTSPLTADSFQASPARPVVPNPNSTTTLVAPVAPNPNPAPSLASSAVTNPNPVVPLVSPVLPNPHMLATPVDVPVAVNPVINPSRQGGANVDPLSASRVAATDPIVRPETTPVPDPVEEELNTPMKAAAPVPGSIGSAVSGPVSGGAENGIEETQILEDTIINNVPFNDPAHSAEQKLDKEASKKKTNRNTLIALIIVAVMVIIALIAVLILQSGGMFGGSQTTTPDSSVSEYGEDKDASDTGDMSSGSEGGAADAEGVSTSVVCMVEGIAGADEQGIQGATMTYEIVDNKVTGAEASYVVANESGSVNTVTETMTLIELFPDLETTTYDFIEADGTLKVTPKVFAERITEIVEESGSEEGYYCSVE